MPPSPNNPPSSRLLGYLSGLGFIGVWSGFIVFSRMGVTGSLTPFDITAVRFMVGGLITLPFVYLYWPKHLSLAKVLILATTGPGAIYSVLMYSGLSYSPAAFAGVFANGTMPIFTGIAAFFLLGDRFSQNTAIAISIIIAGSIAFSFEALLSSNNSDLSGIPFFILASVVLAVYVVLLRLWGITAKQTLAIINLPNVLVFLPIWYFLLPSTLATADTQEILFQALYQGLGPSFLALIFFTYAIQSLGPTPVAGMAATVPATAALLAIPVLGETLNAIEWGGIITVSVGLMLLLFKKPQSTQTNHPR